MYLLSLTSLYLQYKNTAADKKLRILLPTLKKEK